jgi:hypothetical protein
VHLDWEDRMDGDRFDHIAKTLSSPTTRRSALGLAAGIAALLGSNSQSDAAAKHKPGHKKSCGACREAKKGTCKPKPLGTPCGACRKCQKGRCQPLCAPERCVHDICLIPCDPPCGNDEECFAGVCSKRCDPACDRDEACVNGACVSVSAGCTASDDGCAGTIVICPDGGPGDACYLLNDGQQYCADSLVCNSDGSDLCRTDADCRNAGQGPNARCVKNCDKCNGGNGCVVFYLDF